MNKEIGRRIYEKRTEKEMTLKELGSRVGVASTTILRYEKGEISKIKLPVIESIANVLEVDPAWLILKSDRPTKYIPKKSEVDNIPLIGSIAAGLPLLAEENIVDYFNIDTKIKADFALKVQGNSMIGAGIFQDDIVFIRKQDCLENGEIGVILIEDEATLKKFYKEDDTIILQAENDIYKPLIYTNGNIKILGKLVAVLNIRE